MACRGPGIS